MVNGRDAVEAARAGDGEAAALLTTLGTNLGVGITGLINTFEPERVSIGGGLAAGGADLFLDAAIAEVRARALPAVAERVLIAVAASGADAGVLGAGLLAMHEMERRGDTAGQTLEEEVA